MIDSKLLKGELLELPNKWPGNCFGCSPKNQHGLQLKVLKSEDGCMSYTKISEKFCGFEGLVHGGIIATLLDEIAAWTLITHLKKLCITQQATIKYFKPVYIDKPIIVEGKILERSEHSVKTIANVKDMNEHILAQCESSWIIPDLQTLANLTGKDLETMEYMYNSFIEPIENLNKSNNLRCC